MTYFHYTHIGHLPSICQQRRLLPSESNVGAPFRVGAGPVGENAGPPVVWLLDEPVILNPDPQAHGLYPEKRRIRIEVDVRAIRWLDWAPAAAMDPEWRRIFIQTAGGPEVVEHWYVVPAPIRDRRWVSIRDMDNDMPIAYDVERPDLVGS